MCGKAGKCSVQYFHPTRFNLELLNTLTHHPQIAMDDPSITSLKSTFLRTQVRVLETPLQPPSTTTTLTPKLTADLVSKVNDKIKQHNRLIFSTQSQLHVAEQIESLHWNLVSSQTAQAELDTVIVRRDAELTEESLPEEYEDLFLHPEHEVQEEERRRYEMLRGKLVELTRRRDVLRDTLVRYEHLRGLVGPLDEPQKNVQPNLVTKDGELSRELDKMRVLLARVTARIGDVDVVKNTSSTTKQKTSKPQTDQQRLARAMELG